MRRFSSNLVKEVIQNFGLKSNFFDLRRPPSADSREDSPGKADPDARAEHSSERPEQLQKINEFLGENDGIGSPTSRRSRNKKIKIISQFDNTLNDLGLSGKRKASDAPALETRGLKEDDSEYFLIQQQEAPESVPGFGEFALTETDGALDSSLETATERGVLEAKTLLLGPAAKRPDDSEADEGLLEPKAKLKRSQAKTCLKMREKSTDLQSLGLDESVMDIVIQNFDQSEEKRHARGKSGAERSEKLPGSRALPGENKYLLSAD